MITRKRDYCVEDDCCDVGKGLGVVLKSDSPRPLEVAGLPTSNVSPEFKHKVAALDSATNKHLTIYNLQALSELCSVSCGIQLRLMRYERATSFPP